LRRATAVRIFGRRSFQVQQALAAFLVLAQAANKGSPFRAGEYRTTWFCRLDA